MASDLSTELSILQSHMDGMIDRVHHNDQALQKLQMFELQLLNLNTLPETINHIFDDARELFGLDVISFCLVDANGEYSKILAEESNLIESRPGLIFLENADLLNSTFGHAVRPYIGSYKKSKCSGFFVHATVKPASVAIIPLHRRGRYLGALSLGSMNPRRFIGNMATHFIEHMATVVSVCLENNLNFESLKRTSLVDTLTGINNRRFLEQRLDEEIYRSRRNIEPLSCLFLDIDFFKSINDTYGHQAGDLVLVEVSAAIKDQLRNNDIVARYGGEEFVALLSGIDEVIAFDIAERIRIKVKNLNIRYKKDQLKVTISIGLSSFIPDPNLAISEEEVASELINYADTALYKAKENGRDCVISNGLIAAYTESAKAV